MSSYVEFQYISPMSRYSFPKSDNRYILVLVNTGPTNTLIHKTELKDLDNVSKTVRGYSIGRTVKVYPAINYPTFSIKVFRHNMVDNTIHLLFTGFLENERYEFGAKSNLRLEIPPGPTGLNSRSTIFKGDRSFLEEQFYNFTIVEDKTDSPSCLIFFTKVRFPFTELFKTVKPRLDSDSIYVFSRYSNTLIQEFMPERVKNRINEGSETPTLSKKHYIHAIDFINKYCGEGDFMKFIKEYQLVGYQFDPKSIRILDLFRPLKYEPYLNTTIVSPVDSRIRGFKINPSLKLAINSKPVGLKDIISKPYEVLEGSGFISRLAPQDNQQVSIPYSGYLKEINVANRERFNMVTLKVESDYFLPHSVEERDLLSVVNGHYTYGGSGVGAGTRWWPQYLEPQPKIKLIYHLVMISGSNKSRFRFTTPKLEGVKNKIGKGSPYRIKPMWMEQGQVIGRFLCGEEGDDVPGGGSMILLFCNRSIDFTSDIQHFSRMSSVEPVTGPSGLNRPKPSIKPSIKPFDCYIKMRDIIGVLN